MPKSPKPPITVDVAPEMPLYQVLRSQRYQKSRALAEFVDNSIQSYIDNENTLKTLAGKKGYPIPKISIYAYSAGFSNKDKQRSIIIKDNAGGISQQDFQQAVKPGTMNPNKKSAQSLNEFGIGMKSAAIWFSKHWKIKTTYIGETEMLSLDFNLDELIKKSQSSIVVPRDFVKGEEHGTTVSLFDSDQFIEDIEEARNVLSELQEIFILFIRQRKIDLRFYFNNEEVCVDHPLEFPTVLIASLFDSKHRPVNTNKRVWSMNVSLNIKNKKIGGFICIREKGSYTLNPGIMLFKNGRLIEGTIKTPYLPVGIFSTSNKYGRQRVYGELHLDNFDTDFSKSIFVDDGMKEFHAKLKKFLAKNDFLDQITNYRSKGDPKPTPPSTVKTPTARRGNFFHLSRMLSEIRDKASDAKLEKIIDEMLLITESSRSPKSPMLIAMGLRSVVEKSLYLAVQRKEKTYNPKESPPFLTDIMNDIQRLGIISNKAKIFDQLKKDGIITLHLVTHNTYIPSDEENERFATNYSGLILSLYDD